jgi:hypothetical protein
LTSVRKRLDHVLVELETIGTEPNEAAAKNILAELAVIHSAYRESEKVPMCCFKYDAAANIVCDVAGPLEHSLFIEKCRQCQSGIKEVLVNLQTN